MRIGRSLPTLLKGLSRTTTLIAAASALLVLGLSSPASAAGLACDDSIKAAFKPDDQTRVTLVKRFRQGEAVVISEPVTQYTPTAAADLCLVKLIVGPGNPGPAGAPSTSPGIGIEVWLPDPAKWNGRIHNVGGRGGFDGGTHTSTSEVAWPIAVVTAGTEGAVSASTDIGHAPTDGSWGMDPDGTLAKPLWQDYAHRAMHEMAAKTKALTAAFYGKPAKYAYYEGSSTGGRHGYRLAQQYPDDYDGIVANLPALNWAEWTTAAVYRYLVIERDLGGVPLTDAQQDLVSNAAISACDMVGGQHLGYIMDNAACRYDPTKDLAVLCVGEGGRNTTADCVTRVQANAVNKMWYGITTDGSVPSPELDNGASARLGGRHLWFGLMRGTSLYNAYFSRLGYRSSAKNGYIAGQVALELQNPTIAEPTFKNASGDGQGLWQDLSYKQLANAFARGVALNPVFGDLASDNPDLSAFKARGGKFLSWHGWNDEAIPVQGSIRYYDRVIEKMGGAANVRSFFKLYLVPGAGHLSPNGTSNPGAVPPLPAPGQLYKLLVDWVERGIEPRGVVLNSPAASAVKRSAPACAYPQIVTYTGGDPDQAKSFRCAEPAAGSRAK